MLAILIFVFVFHYVRFLDNQNIFRVLSAVAFVGMDQVAELNKIRISRAVSGFCGGASY